MLNVKDLTIAFGNNTVVQEFNLSISTGQSLGVVGESGSGKSVTALALMGLLPTNARVISGNAIYNAREGKGIDLLKLSQDEHRKVRGKHVAMVFQEPMTALNPSMRCGRQVEESIRLHQRVSRLQVKGICLSLLREMQLPNPEKVHKSYPHQLSGGQKQRVVIAIALAGNPSILIADEPTTALDVTVQREILALIKRIQQKRNMSLLFISHDLGVISEITGNILVMKDGTVVEKGTTQNILKNPQHPYTKGLVACRPPLHSRPWKLPTINDFQDKPEDFKLITSKEWEATNNKIYSHTPIIEVQRIDVEYDIRRNFLGKSTEIFNAVKGMDFNLYKGETLGLVGESGCGKTTLGRAIMGLVGYSKGHITYMGSEVSKKKKPNIRRFRREVQFIFQDPFSSLNPRHTIGEAILEPLMFHQIVKGLETGRQRVKELLNLVALPADCYYRYPHEFSGGQRQRVAIARALALDPKVLVCDEIVSALDVSVQAQILNLLNKLKRELYLTYIFISHDLSVVRYMSNRMLVMRNGMKVEYGDSDTMFFNPKTEYSKKLINSVPRANT